MMITSPSETEINGLYADLFDRYEVGAHISYRTIQGSRPVTVIGYASDGMALYVEGHVSVKVTHPSNLTIEN